jgi:hypothetical protein
VSIEKKDKRADLINKRRKALLENDSKKYTMLVKIINKSEEADVYEFMARVVDILGISRELFEITHFKLVNDQGTESYVMAA